MCMDDVLTPSIHMCRIQQAQELYRSHERKLERLLPSDLGFRLEHVWRIHADTWAITVL